MRVLRSHVFLVTTLVVFCILGSAASAAVYRVLSTGTPGVDCEFTTLSEAINAAQLTYEDDTVLILDSATYKENFPAVGAFDIGDLTIEAAEGQTPTITRAAVDAGAVFYMQGIGYEPAPVITIRGASPSTRIKIRNESGMGYLIYCGPSPGNNGNLVLENAILERPTDTSPGSTGWYFNFEWNGTVTWRNVDVTGANPALNNFQAGFFYGLGEVLFENCNLTFGRTMYADGVAGAGAAFWYGPGNPDLGYEELNAMNLTFNNCNFEPEAVGDNKMGIFWTQMRAGSSLDSFPNGTVTFNNCRIREDDGFVTPFTGNWQRSIRAYGPSTWRFINPTFTGRCGDIFFFTNGTYAVGSTTYTFPPPNVLFEGTAENPVNFDALTSGTQSTAVICRMRNGGEATFRHCRNTVRSSNLLDFTFNYALTAPGIVNFENCYFLNGCGQLVLKPGSASGSAGVMSDSPYEMVVNARNSVWEGHGANGAATFDSGGPGAYSTNTVRTLPTTYNLSHCTFFNTSPTGFSRRTIQATTTAAGGKVDDILNAQYCIFQSTWSADSRPASNLPLQGTRNVAIWDWGISGFPSVPADTAVFWPSLDTTAGSLGRLTESSFAALGGAVGSTETVDIEGETRPQPSGTHPDIGADEASFTASYSTQPSIAAAKALSGQPLIEVEGVITQKFTYGDSPFFYMADPGRVAGIRVAPVEMPPYEPGSTVRVRGSIVKVGRSATQGILPEDVLMASSVSLVSSGEDAPKALGMINRSVRAGYDGAAAQNQGVLGKIWGVVTQVDPLKRIYWVNDGSNSQEGIGLLDGGGNPLAGIRVVVADPGAELPDVGDYVGVTGGIGAVLTPNAANNAMRAVPCVWQSSAEGF